MVFHRCSQCLDTVGWLKGGASSLWKTYSNYLHINRCRLTHMACCVPPIVWHIKLDAECINRQWLSVAPIVDVLWCNFKVHSLGKSDRNILIFGDIIISVLQFSVGYVMESLCAKKPCSPFNYFERTPT